MLRFRLGSQLHVRSGPGGGDERHPLRKHAGVGHLRRLRRSRKLGRLRFQNRVSISGRFHLPRRTSCQGLRVRRLRSGQRFQHGQEELPALFQDAVQNLPRHLRPSWNNFRFGRSIGYRLQGTLSGWEILQRRDGHYQLAEESFACRSGQAGLTTRMDQAISSGEWSPVDFAVKQRHL